MGAVVLPITVLYPHPQRKRNDDTKILLDVSKITFKASVGAKFGGIR